MVSNQREMTQRKTYFIQKAFQTKMMAKFVLLLTVMATISSVTLYFLAGSELKSSYYEAHSSIKSMWDILGPTVLITNFISLFIISIATVYVILYISHKIAGPLFKLEKSINEISGGNLHLHLGLREGDQLKTLSDSLKNLVSKFSERIKVMKLVSNDMFSLEEKLKTLEEKESISREEMKEIHRLLKGSAMKLDRELEKFQLGAAR